MSLIRCRIGLQLTVSKKGVLMPVNIIKLTSQYMIELLLMERVKNWH
jgi:hypothetical protein